MTLRLAVFGQAPFGREVTEKLAKAGHEIAAVYAPPDAGRPDPLAELASENDWLLHRYKRFRSKGEAIPELVAEYLELDVDLNVMPFTTAILPPEITDAPRHGSLCFHPSLLPAYRGGAALAWQIMLGATESGVSVFRVRDGVDAGPLVVQRGGVAIDANETMASLYFDKLFPIGVEAMIEAVGAVANGTAEYREQSTEGVSEQGLVTAEVARIDWGSSAVTIDRKIRGCDPSPGAIADRDGEAIRVFGGSLSDASTDAPPGTIFAVDGDAVLVACGEGSVRVEKVRGPAGKKVTARDYGLAKDDQLN